MALTAPPVDLMRDPPPDDAAFRKALYAIIQKPSRMTQAEAKQVYEAIIEAIVKRAIEVGYVRLPNGYGTFKLAKVRFAALRKMPRTGESVVPTENKVKLKYNAGVAVRELLGTNVHKYRRKTPRPTFVDPMDEGTPV